MRRLLLSGADGYAVPFDVGRVEVFGVAVRRAIGPELVGRAERSLREERAAALVVAPAPLSESWRPAAAFEVWEEVADGGLVGGVGAEVVELVRVVVEIEELEASTGVVVQLP